jgi:hypothetical protein
MMPQTKLGRFRAFEANMTAHQLATEARKRGCLSLTTHRLRRIESGETLPSAVEKEAVAEILGVRSWELPL